jgi:hypothetical protein
MVDSVNKRGEDVIAPVPQGVEIAQACTDNGCREQDGKLRNMWALLEHLCALY